MDVSQHIERILSRAVDDLADHPCPPRLAEALRYAMFPGGARVRPRLVMAVAQACADASAPLAHQSAVAIEFLHAASLIQDDLRCFDDAALRRGKPSLHLQYDERLAILASDALIVGAFDCVACCEPAHSAAAMQLVSVFARHTGSRYGITAGQAWESESSVDVEAYHQAKTAALFAAATQAGAISVGVDDAPWARTGSLVGSAYQIADDIHDILGDSETLGKPVQVDIRHDRPNAVLESGVESAVKQLRYLIEQVVESIPPCRNADFFIETIQHEARRFLPKEVALSAA